MKRILALAFLIVLLIVIGTKQGYFQEISFEKYLTENSPPKETLKVTSEESAVVSAVRKALPSVVTVAIIPEISEGVFLNPFDPFNSFSLPRDETQADEQSIGSGFIVRKDGIIVTNKHVVSGEGEYFVITNNNKRYPVKDIFRDPLNDLAIIKIEANALPVLNLANSESLELGQIAIAIGTPLGEFQNTVTTGVISGLGRGITAGSPYEGFVEKLDNVIQTDAAINPGNSGGPLLNSAGEVIGVNTAVSQEGQNIGFAIPVNVLSEVLNNFQSSGDRISRPFLGVRYKLIDRETAIMNDLPEGAYVLEVIAESNAENAGIQRGDVITKIDGQKITEEDDITKLIGKKKVGEVIKLELWSEGKKTAKTITLGEYQ